jgi:hypothetical protein
MMLVQIGFDLRSNHVEVCGGQSGSGIFSEFLVVTLAISHSTNCSTIQYHPCHYHCVASILTALLNRPDRERNTVSFKLHSNISQQFMMGMRSLKTG